ncbi:MAG: hypothetical protein AAFP19_26080 [Bacteroidota bacterium]
MKREDFLLFSFIVLVCFLSFSPLNRSTAPAPIPKLEKDLVDTTQQKATASNTLALP